MDRKSKRRLSPLYQPLLAMGVKPKYARELENLRHHCGYSTFAVDSAESADIVICSTSLSRKQIDEILILALKNGTTLAILSPYLTPERGEMCNAIIAAHTSTTLTRRGYLIVFNNHLPKQHFTL